MDLESSEALKVKDDDQEDTDEPERDTWSGRFDFLLSLLGYSVGLGNVWRFPYLAYNNGGGAFLVPFAIMLVLAGLPLMFMELAFGQYAALGPVAVYNQFSPLFRGLGYGMVIVSTIVMLYYNLIIAWTIWYILASATRVLPWHTCDPAWSTEYCYSYELANECLERNQTYYLGLCHNLTEGMVPAALQKRHPPAEEYFTKRVLGLSSGIEDIGSVRWEMALCLLAAWVIVFLCLCKGVHSSGKVVYFTALFPYVVLVILFVRGVTLPGAGTGILYYLTPDWSRLANAQVWGDAAVQIFFALSPAWGGLITLSSYNKFSNNCYVDSLIVAASNICTSFFAGLVIFAVIGFLAHELNVSVDKVVDQGAGLAFIVYPEVVTRLPIAPLWSLLFFIMLLTLGLDSQFALMETVTTAILDGFPGLRSRKAWVVFGVAVFGYLGGLIFTTNSGMYWLQLMDKYAANWSVLMLAIMECVLIAWVYGTDRFCADIQLMIGKQSKLWVFFWSFMWRFTTPTALIFILVFNWVEYRPAQYGTYVYPKWADAVGWTLGLLPVLVVLLMALAQICNGPDELNIIETARMLSQPTREWGAGDAKAMGITGVTNTTGTMDTSATTGTTSSTAVLLMRGRGAPRDHQPCMLLPRGSLTRRASQDSNTSHEKIGAGSHKPKRHGRKSLAQSLSQDSSDPTIEPLLKGDDNYSETRDKCTKLQSIKTEENKNYRDVSYTKLPTISTPVKNIPPNRPSHYSILESDMEGNQSTMSILNKRRESATKKKIDFAHSTQNDIQMTTFSKSEQGEPSSGLIEGVLLSDSADTTSDEASLVKTDSVILTTAKIHLNSKNICPVPSQVLVIPIPTSFENKSYDPSYKSVLSTFGPAKDHVDENTEIGVAQNIKNNTSKTASNIIKSVGIPFQETKTNLTKVSSNSIHVEPILKNQENYTKIPLTKVTNSELRSKSNVKPITTTVDNLDVVETIDNVKHISTALDSNLMTNNSAVVKSVETTKYVSPTSCDLFQAKTSENNKDLNTNKAMLTQKITLTTPNITTAETKASTPSEPATIADTNLDGAMKNETKPKVTTMPSTITILVEANSTNSAKTGTTPSDNSVNNSKLITAEPNFTNRKSVDSKTSVVELEKGNLYNNDRPSTSQCTKIPQIKSSVTKPVTTSISDKIDTTTPVNIESVPATNAMEVKVSTKTKPVRKMSANFIETGTSDVIKSGNLMAASSTGVNMSNTITPKAETVSNVVKVKSLPNTVLDTKVPATPAERKSSNPENALADSLDKAGTTMAALTNVTTDTVSSGTQENRNKTAGNLVRVKSSNKNKPGTTSAGKLPK